MSGATILTDAIDGKFIPDGHETEDDRIERRMKEWREQFVVDGPFAEFEFRQLVVESIRVERCQDEGEARSRMAAIRAELCWDEDRTAEALAVAAKLSRNPERWRAELLRTARGCSWMITQWKNLRDAYNHAGKWSERERSRALDLLGVSRLDRDRPTPIELAGDQLLEYVEDEIRTLQSLLNDSLAPADEHERSVRAKGLTLRYDAEHQALRKFESGCLRRFLDLVRKLGPKAHRGEASPAEGSRTESHKSAYTRSVADFKETIAMMTEHLSIREPAPVPRPERLPTPNANPEPRAMNRKRRRKLAALARKEGG